MRQSTQIGNKQQPRPQSRIYTYEPFSSLPGRNLVMRVPFAVIEGELKSSIERNPRLTLALDRTPERIFKA